MKWVNKNGKIKGNGVVAKLLFLISVYEVPLLLKYYLFNYYYYHYSNIQTMYSGECADCKYCQCDGGDS